MNGVFFMAAAVLVSVLITKPMLGDVVDQRAANEQIRGNYGKAISLAQRALWIDPNAAYAPGRIVRMEREQGQLAQSLGDADRFAAVHFSVDLRAERARTLFAMRKYYEAGLAFDALLQDADELRLRPRRFVLTDVLYDETAWELYGDRRRAKRAVEVGLKLDPSNGPLLSLEAKL